MKTTSAATTHIELARALIALPFAASDVLAIFADIHSSHASRLLADWEATGWVQSCRPSCLGRSRHLLYTFTATGLRAWIPTLLPHEDLVIYATNHHLDPVGLVAYYVPRLLRLQTLYAAAARIYIQARQDHPTVALTWVIDLDVKLHLTHIVPSTHKRRTHTAQIVVTSDLYLTIGIPVTASMTWHAAQIWLDDGLAHVPRLQARVQTMQRYFTAVPRDAVPLTVIIVRDLARIALWDEAIQPILHHDYAAPFPGAIALLPVTWPWPLTCGGVPAPQRAWTPLYLPVRSHSIFGVPVDPPDDDAWRARAIPETWLPWHILTRKQRPHPEAARYRITAWRRMCLIEPTFAGTIMAVRAELPQRTAQKYAQMAAIAVASLDMKSQLLTLLLCVAWTPMIASVDLAQLFHVSLETLRDLLSLLQARGYVAVVTPPPHATLPALPGAASGALQGVRATEAGIALVQAFYPHSLAVYHRATRIPRAHDSGIGRFFRLFDSWLRELVGVGTLWWWAGPGNRLRVYLAHERQRLTVYPDARGICLIEERPTMRDPPTLRYQTFFLEWDMGHERRAVWQQKIARYRQWLEGRMGAWGQLQQDRHHGWYFVLFVVAPSERQATMIGTLLRQDFFHGLPGPAAKRCRCYVTTFAQLVTGAFDAGWTTIGQERDGEPFLITRDRLSAATIGGVAWSQELLARWSVADLEVQYQRRRQEAEARLQTRRARVQRQYPQEP